MGKKAPAEFHYVQWDFRRWLASETRSRANAIGGLMGQAVKGVYRDLLDTCYDAGTIPADMIGLAASAGCTVAEMEQIWPHIEGKFKRHGKLPNRLTNNEVELRRREFVRSVKQKSRAGAKSAQKRGLVTTSENNELGNTRSTEVQHPFNNKEKNREEQNRTDKNREEAAAANAAVPNCAADPQERIADAMGAYTGRPDAGLIATIFQECLSIDPEFTPELMELAVHAVAREGLKIERPVLFKALIVELVGDRKQWQFLKTFPANGATAQNISDAHAYCRDRNTPERMRRFLSAWLAQVRSQEAA